MAARLKILEIEDFKTYFGKHIIGPFAPFTGIVGPNGGGKSNLMDAIAFVLGEKVTALRVRHARDLVHTDRMLGRNKAGGESPTSTVSTATASVIATFSLAGGEEKSFRRVASTRGSEFLVQGEHVSFGHYQEALKKLGINAHCHNFMVFQGTVESIATRGSWKNTEMFEKISGSGALAQDYKQLKEELTRVEEKMSKEFEQRIVVRNHLKECRNDLKKEQEYKMMEEECESKKVKLQLFYLYHIEKNSKSLEEELKVAEMTLKDLEEKGSNHAKLVEEKLKKQTTAVEEATSLEHMTKELERQLNSKHSELITAKEVLREREKKEELCLKILSRAKDAQETQQRELEQLEEELGRVERLAAQFKVESQESLQMGTDIQLQEEQMREYQRLKCEVAQHSAPLQQELARLARQHRTQLDGLANEERRESETREVLHRKKEELREACQRWERFEEHLKIMNKTLLTKKNALKKLEESITTRRSWMKSLQGQLAAVTEELNEAAWDVSQAEQQQEKQAVVERLHSLFPGVYDRLGNLCQPIHERYQLAITRVLLKHMYSIVVDTEATARRCIKYLADKRMGRETFLPLNYLQPCPIRESLRAIPGPPPIRLAFDLVKFEPPEIKVAVLYAMRDTVVCETPEEAMKVAYELCGEDGKEKRLSSVALDGTLYNKSGLMSGGKMELEQKARRWRSSNVAKLMSKKSSLMREMWEAQKVTREESEMKMLEAQASGLEAQVKYTTIDGGKLLEHIKEAEEELKKTEEELERHITKHKEIQDKMTGKESEIAEINAEIQKVEDEVFTQFCREIGVPNIRLYEEQDLWILMERADKRLNYEKQKSRIQSQIEYERDRDKAGDVKKSEASVISQKALVEQAKEEERIKVKEVEEATRAVEEVKAGMEEEEKAVKVWEEAVEAAHAEARKIRRQREKVQHKVLYCKQKFEALKVERHNIMKQSWMKNLKLPLISGTLHHLALREAPPLDSSTSRSSIDQDEASSPTEMQGSKADIRVDFSSLPGVYKKLEGEEQQKEVQDIIKGRIKALEKTLEAMQPPCRNAGERLAQARQQVRDIDAVLQEKRKQVSNANEAFQEVRKQRYDLFMDCFTCVTTKIDQLYKALCDSSLAQAVLEASNPEEPYLGPVVYHCIPPGKRCQDMWSLSGGEKAVAALALLFALQSYRPAPFFLLDEVDAALDKHNIRNVSAYIRQHQQEVQALVISHQLEHYHRVDALFGITCDMVNNCARSKVFSLDLTQYRRSRSRRCSSQSPQQEPVAAAVASPDRSSSLSPQQETVATAVASHDRSSSQSPQQEQP